MIFIILHPRTFGFPQSETFQQKSADVLGRQKAITEDQSKDILNSILNEDILPESDSEDPVEEFANFVKLH